MAITKVRVWVVALSALAACHSATAVKGPFDGSWQGGDATAMLTLNLSDDNGAVKGSGDLDGSSVTGGDIPFSVSGASNGNSMTLTLHANGFVNVTLGGTLVQADTVDATLNGGGFSSYPFVLHR
ncbi:MAG TPA: hypothetical protein VNX15_05205 [Gemmatimonadales bacterium]|jgi:hypothetical protein|nr:hypothetical protein [Gemmatimonadales bacterium]